jgi:hypothetical protein
MTDWLTERLIKKTELKETNSMEVNPFGEANKLLANQEIPRILCKPEVYYNMYKNPSPTPNLSQIDLVHTPFLKIHFIIIFPPPRYSK